ncbi:MAG: 2-oxo-4-hydroxy-4-carboxy-5-ureidoimidazoline decarboxylase [Synechococcales cyanobacterium C42_A2020_086]|jgi:2-oxo-4-hydroxy-4-carboxy-5-ureidoimidazoline decarboxylase|nr:2-oxo-4-hydroxy-4-carboxy-5-ureidoimidazoline decarboxylase [Synechococcales cyanobacterium C42_A2020_086]
MTYSIAALNAMSQSEFTAALETVFEDTPEVARRVWQRRPFRDVADLHQQMVTVVQAMTPDEQLALIRAHPDLGTRAKMADASVQEQAGAGLNRLSPEEYERFQQLNHTYWATFGFPFIVAVKNHTKESILSEFERRLRNSIRDEQNQALAEINQIAWFRLLDLVDRSQP